MTLLKNYFSRCMYSSVVRDIVCYKNFRLFSLVIHDIFKELQLRISLTGCNTYVLMDIFSFFWKKI